MAIRQRVGRKKPWEVYWNNPFTLKRESLYVETEEEAKKQDALKKFQLKYERDFFRREEAEAPQVEHTFESAYYLFLKDKRFSERSLKRHLKNMKRSLAFLKDTPLSDIDNTKLKQLMSHFLSFGIRASTLKDVSDRSFQSSVGRIKTNCCVSFQGFPSFPISNTSTSSLPHSKSLLWCLSMHRSMSGGLSSLARKWGCV